MIKKKYIDLFRVDPEKKVRLKDHDTGWAQNEEFKEFGKDNGYEIGAYLRIDITGILTDIGYIKQESNKMGFNK
jgi:hypothetical protein